MKKLLTLLTVVLLPMTVLAQALPPVVAYQPPQWLTDVLTWVQGVPKIGGVVVMVLTVLSVVCTLMTVVATALDGFIKATSGIAKMAGLDAAAANILAGYAKIEPYVKYLSMYNVQKKDKSGPPAA